MKQARKKQKIWSSTPKIRRKSEVALQKFTEKLKWNSKNSSLFAGNCTTLVQFSRIFALFKYIRHNQTCSKSYSDLWDWDRFVRFLAKRLLSRSAGFWFGWIFTFGWICNPATVTSANLQSASPRGLPCAVPVRGLQIPNSIPGGLQIHQNSF